MRNSTGHRQWLLCSFYIFTSWNEYANYVSTLLEWLERPLNYLLELPHHKIFSLSENSLDILKKSVDCGRKLLLGSVIKSLLLFYHFYRKELSAVCDIHELYTYIDCEFPCELTPCKYLHNKMYMDDWSPRSICPGS